MILGVLLAAGTGSRFADGNKLLADVAGRPVVVRAADALLESAVDDAVAVTGHRAADVADVLDPLGLRTIHNPAFEDGQSASVRRGVEVARLYDADAVLFALGDMPCVRSRTINALCNAYATGDADAVVPTVEGERGNPVVFGESHFDALAAVSGDEGGRHVLADADSARIETADPGVRFDVDTREDLRRAQDCFAGADRE